MLLHLFYDPLNGELFGEKNINNQRAPDAIKHS